VKYEPPADAREVLALDYLGPPTAVEFRYAPGTLYAAGDVELLRAARKVAIVGSREASPEGLRRAARLATELVAAGVVIVSGLAAGIDRAAHEAAIRAGGRTIAVIGTPLTKVFPAAHARLQEQIYRDQLLISQFPAGHKTFPSDFVKRNRTMALLTHASVIVEARDGSGSLSQAAETQRLGRPLFFMKSVLENAALTWPERFRVNGAHVLEATDQILKCLPALPPTQRAART
jgi:DNA processing protein